MINIKRIHTALEWEQECYNEIATLISCASGKINIALSGGSTPIPIYKRIGEWLESLPVSKTENICFFLVDERNASIKSSRSNSAMLLNTIGKKFVIPFDPTVESPENYFSKMLNTLGDSANSI